MLWIQRVGFWYRKLMQFSTNRFKKAFAVILDERFEESHPQHFALTLVDARCEEVMHIVTKQVAVQKRTTTMCLHE